MGLSAKIYEKIFVKRYDKEEHLKYFTSFDFPGLNKTDINFKSAQGFTLNGAIYTYDNSDESTIVVFCHGIGCGHLSYMREIETLCRAGFTVLAYDNTGCDLSEGVNIRGFTQSLSDLNSCIDYIRTDNELKNRCVYYIVGHSWGGYAAGNILSFRNDIEKSVIISGFVSVEIILRQFLKGVLSVFVPMLMKIERERNPEYADSVMTEAFSKTSAKVFVIQSDDDPMVNFSSGIGFLKDKVKNDNVIFKIVRGKKHNPNYTVDAVNYFNKCFSELNNAIKTHKVKTVEEKKNFMSDVDWYRMTEQDDEVWNVIFDFLNN